MRDPFHEINEDIREQQLRDFWRENGAWIIGGILLAIVATGGISLWKNWQEKNNRRQTAELIQVLNQEDIAKLDAFAQKAGARHKALARLLEAGLYIQRGESGKALEKLDALAKDGSIPRLWRDLAKTQAIALSLDTPNAAPEEDIQKLAQSEKNPWAPLARELHALALSQKNDYAAAAETLAGIIADPRASQGIKARAVSLRDYYATQNSRP